MPKPRIFPCPQCQQPMEFEFVQGDGGGLVLKGGPLRHYNHYLCRCHDCDAEYIADGKPLKLRVLDRARETHK